MKPGTGTRYSARAMVDLALHYEDGNGVVPAGEIGARQQVSPKYLEHQLASLRAAGLVRSVRGAKGGHTLARPRDEITLREIYDVFEGVEGFVECTTSPEFCESNPSPLITGAFDRTWDLGAAMAIPPRFMAVGERRGWQRLCSRPI